MTDVHPQVLSLMEAMGGDSAEEQPDIAALRAGYLQRAIEYGGAAELVASVEDIVIASHTQLLARRYAPRAVFAEGVIVWLHGGGWFMGDLDGFDRVCRALANASGVEVLSVDYRLAPEHTFPAAVDDADAAVRWAVERFGERVVVGGDSAGGNVAAAAVLRARADGIPLAGQLLVYPALDADCATGSFTEFEDAPMLRKSEMVKCWTGYLAGADPTSPDASPARAPSLDGLPPTYIAVAGNDVLRDDGLEFGDALRAAGVPVEVECYEDMVHGFLRWGGVVDRAQELIAALGGAARGMLRAE